MIVRMNVVMNRFRVAQKHQIIFYRKPRFYHPKKLFIVVLSRQFPFFDILFKYYFSIGFLDNFSFDIAPLGQNVK